MNIEFRDGLLFTSIIVTFQGVSKKFENIVIDTGASETIISPDAVEGIGIIAELSDTVNSFYGVGGSLHSFFSKKVEEIRLGQVNFSARAQREPSRRDSVPHPFTGCEHHQGEKPSVGPVQGHQRSGT